MKKRAKIIILILIIILLGFFVYRNKLRPKEREVDRDSIEVSEENINLNQDLDNENLNQTSQESIKEKVKEVVKESVEAVEEVVAEMKNEEIEGLPEVFDQEMAFARQAPFGKWDDLFLQDACEEASLITADRFFKGLPLDEKIMQQELEKVKPWELEKFGENISINTEEVAIMAREYFGLEAEVSSEVTVERIKKEIAAGSLIVLPLTGREVGNPYYTGEGPLYHMLVVKGYDRDQFITNDPGTRRGKGYKYKYDVLIKATHDWNDGDIYQGQRLMIILAK